MNTINPRDYPCRPLSTLRTNEALLAVEDNCSEYHLTLFDPDEHYPEQWNIVLKEIADQDATNTALTGVYYADINLIVPRAFTFDEVLNEQRPPSDKYDWRLFTKTLITLTKFLEYLHGENGLTIQSARFNAIDLHIHGDEGAAVLDEAVYDLLSSLDWPFFIEFRLPYIRISPVAFGGTEKYRILPIVPLTPPDYRPII